MPDARRCSLQSQLRLIPRVLSTNGAPVTLVALLLATLATADAGVQPPLRVQTHAVKPQALLGEVFTVEVVITHDRAQRYELKAPGDLGSFDYVRQGRERIDGADSSTTTFHVELQGFELGPQRTPDLEFELTDPAGVQLMPVSGTAIEIVSSLPPDAKDQGANLYDVRTPEELPVRTWRLVWALLIALATALIAYGVYRYLKRPKPVPLIPQKPLEPAHIRARAALDALASQNLPVQGRAKEFYFRLSEIIRSYLGELYSFEALESTTPELMEALRSRTTPGLPFDQLRDFATQSDFVRYAKQEPSPDECKHALEVGYLIVHATSVAIGPQGGERGA